MSKHTPGPWRFYTEPQPNGCPIIGDSRGVMTAMLAHSINYDDQRDEAIANARLIAAAPDLLEAVTRLLMSGDVRDACEAGALKAARAAIAKATGEAA